MSVESIINQMIQEALSRAADMADAAKGYSDDAIQAVGTIALNRPNTLITATPPTFTGSLDDPTSTVLSNYDANAGALVDKLATTFAGFLDTWFPRTNACLTSAEQWLCDTIQNGGTGIPADVENQIWERSRARELTDANRLEEEAYAEFASRGFSMPPGALVERVDRIRQDAANKVSTHGRDVAIKQAEIHIDTIKFAVSEALKYRVAAIQAALDYWKGYLSPYDIAAKRALAEVEITTKFYNSALEYFKAEISLYGHVVNAQATQIGDELKAYGMEISGVGEWAQARSIAAGRAAQAVGAIGASAQSGLNTLAQYGYAENKES